MRRIGECNFLEDWIFRSSRIYIRKEKDGIVHAVKMQRWWKSNFLSMDVTLCVFLDKIKRIVHDGTTEFRVFHKKYNSLTIPINLIELDILSKLCGISDERWYTFMHVGDEADVVERIKYELDCVANVFFDGQYTIDSLINTSEIGSKNKTKGIWLGDRFNLAALYYVAGRKEECRKFLESWGSSSMLKGMEIQFRKYMMERL